MISYSQRYPQWATQKLGDSSLTLGRYGCTTTCIADLSTYFGDNLTPLQVEQKIKYIQGLVIWSSCVFSKFAFERREYGRNDQNIALALKDPNKAVILNVASGSHWVVATGGTVLYSIADPWFGDKSTMKRYGNDITGAAYFYRIN